MKYKSQSTTPLSSADYDANLKELENRVNEVELAFISLKNRVAPEINLTPLENSISDLQTKLTLITDGASIDLDTFKEVSDKLKAFQTDLLSKSSAQALLDLNEKINALLPIKSVSGAGATFDANTGELKITGGSSSSSSSGGVTTQTTQVTQLLMHFNGNDGDTTFSDEYGHVFTKVGSPKLSATQSKFGATSLYLPNQSSGLQMPKSQWSSVSFAGGYVIEFFVYLDSTCPSSQCAMIAKWNPSGPTNDWTININGYKMLFVCSNATVVLSGNTTLSKGVWHHIAVVHNPNSLKIFVNGVLDLNTTTAIPTTNNYDICVGGSLGYGIIGYIDELRITTSSTSTVFNVPTAEYTS